MNEEKEMVNLEMEEGKELEEEKNKNSLELNDISFNETKKEEETNGNNILIIGDENLSFSHYIIQSYFSSNIYIAITLTEYQLNQVMRDLEIKKQMKIEYETTNKLETLIENDHFYYTRKFKEQYSNKNVYIIFKTDLFCLQSCFPNNFFNTVFLLLPGMSYNIKEMDLRYSDKVTSLRIYYFLIVFLLEGVNVCVKNTSIHILWTNEPLLKFVEDEPVVTETRKGDETKKETEENSSVRDDEEGRKESITDAINALKNLVCKKNENGNTSSSVVAAQEENPQMKLQNHCEEEEQGIQISEENEMGAGEMFDEEVEEEAEEADKKIMKDNIKGEEITEEVEFLNGEQIKEEEEEEEREIENNEEIKNETVENEKEYEQKEEAMQTVEKEELKLASTLNKVVSNENHTVNVKKENDKFSNASNSDSEQKEEDEDNEEDESEENEDEEEEEEEEEDGDSVYDVFQYHIRNYTGFKLAGKPDTKLPNDERDKIIDYVSRKKNKKKNLINVVNFPLLFDVNIKKLMKLFSLHYQANEEKLKEMFKFTAEDWVKEYVPVLFGNQFVYNDFLKNCKFFSFILKKKKLTIPEELAMVLSNISCDFQINSYKYLKKEYYSVFNEKVRNCTELKEQIHHIQQMRHKLYKDHISENITKVSSLQIIPYRDFQRKLNIKMNESLVLDRLWKTVFTPMDFFHVNMFINKFFKYFIHPPICKFQKSLECSVVRLKIESPKKSQVEYFPKQNNTVPTKGGYYGGLDNVSKPPALAGSGNDLYKTVDKTNIGTGHMKGNYNASSNSYLRKSSVAGNVSNASYNKPYRSEKDRYGSNNNYETTKGENRGMNNSHYNNYGQQHSKYGNNNDMHRTNRQTNASSNYPSYSNANNYNDSQAYTGTTTSHRYGNKGTTGTGAGGRTGHTKADSRNDGKMSKRRKEDPYEHKRETYTNKRYKRNRTEYDSTKNKYEDTRRSERNAMRNLEMQDPYATASPSHDANYKLYDNHLNVINNNENNIWRQPPPPPAPPSHENPSRRMQGFHGQEDMMYEEESNDGMIEHSYNQNARDFYNKKGSHSQNRNY